MSDKEIVWDLTEIFSSCDDPKISETMDALKEKADEVISEYKGKINIPTFTAQNLHDLLEKQEKILADVEDIQVFSENSFYANMTLPETKALKSKFEEFHTKISKKLAFLDLEVGKLINENNQLITSPILKNYKHYLEKIRRESPHRLSEIEEQLILEKDEFGVKAWSQLKNSWLYSRKFKVMVEGEEKILSYGEADSLISVFGAHPDRETRISANKAIYGLLGGDENIYSSALRNICGDWMKNTKRRQYDNPMHQSFITNDITQTIIDNLMKSIEEHVNVYQRYLKIKAKILNLPQLSCADIFAPVLVAKKFSWDEAKRLIIQACSKFNILFEDYVKDMFKKNHIDGSTREGKFSNAYCSSWYKGKSAFVSFPFTGTLGDIFLLAHELGHGIHFHFSSREQTFFNYYPGYTVAETASIFGTLLIADLLLNKAKSDNEKIAILTHMLDNMGGVIFYISMWVWFEQGLYDTLEKGEYLDGKLISKYWCAARDRIYRDSVEWFDEMIWEWIKWPHFYFPNDRFYNYPYIYAQLFVCALYQTYKKEGKAFVPKFKKLLSAGGSLSPEELGKIVDLDIATPDFWKLGMRQYEEFVDELEKLTK